MSDECKYTCKKTPDGLNASNMLNPANAVQDDCTAFFLETFLRPVQWVLKSLVKINHKFGFNNRVLE